MCFHMNNEIGRWKPISGKFEVNLVDDHLLNGIVENEN